MARTGRRRACLLESYPSHPCSGALSHFLYPQGAQDASNFQTDVLVTTLQGLLQRLPGPPQQLTALRDLLQPPTAPAPAADDDARPAAAPDCSPQAADLGRPAVLAPCPPSRATHNRARRAATRACPSHGSWRPCEAYCSSSLAPRSLTRGGMLRRLCAAAQQVTTGALPVVHE
jgi:hypothetical protein